MHLISIKNNKLIKRVAVASLAALMTIPNLTTTSYAISQATIDNWEMNAKKAEAKGNYEKAKEYRDAIAEGLRKDAERNAKNAQIQAQRQAEQAEKDRIANTVYPLTARYVKDFVPAVDDYQPHFYERADLPGVIFTLRMSQFGIVSDENPHMEIIEMPDLQRESSVNGSKELLYTDTCQVIKVNYTSPFNFAGTVYHSSLFNIHPDFNNVYLTDGWCHHIGKNRDVIMDHTIDIHYKSGWPESYLGKSVKEITQANAIQPYGWYPETIYLQRYSLDDIKKSFNKVSFTKEEKITKNHSMRVYVNNYYDSIFDEYDSIYEVAKRYGTDYTDEERQTLVIKPTPVNPYTNAGSEPIVDEQE